MILEIWFNLIIINISVEIEGYKRFRLDCLGKFRYGLKGRVFKDLIGIGELGLY